MAVFGLVSLQGFLPRQFSRVCLSASQGLRRGIGRPFLSVIIKNENLKLLQIYYLARKVDILFKFQGHILLVKELIAKLCIT